MFKKLAILLLVLMQAQWLVAHGVDGCMGNMQLGLNQLQGNTNFFSINTLLVRDQWSSIDFWGSPSITHNNTFITQINAKFFLKEKLAIRFNTAYLRNHEMGFDTDYSVRGMADSKLMLEYFVFNRKNEHNSSFLSFATGVELPTGTQNQLLLQNFSPGSGSYDIPLAVNYLYSKNFSGIKLQAFYQINNHSKAIVQYGDNYAASMSFFKMLGKKNWHLVPQAGFSFIGYKNSVSIYKNKVIENNNAFASLMASAGLTLEKKNWTAGINTNIGLKQHQLFLIDKRRLYWVNLSITRTF
ncbi:hypothetical protein GC194_11890 [bacterium]|nr:hypothetical protein [bacterium]